VSDPIKGLNFKHNVGDDPQRVWYRK